MTQGNEIVLDIETAADVDSPALAALAEEITPPKNWKDQEKIAAYVEQRRRDLIEKAALSPLTGRIVAIGLAIQAPDGEWEEHIWMAGTEAEIIIGANAAIDRAGCGQLVTFNGKPFDIPYLLARSIRHGLELPWPWPVGHRGPHIDVRELLGRQGSLAAWAGMVLNREHTCDGSAVQAMVDAGDTEGIRDHCLEDIRATRDLWERIKLAGIADRY